MKNILKITLTTGLVIGTALVLPKNSMVQSQPQQATGLDTVKIAANTGYDKASKFKRVMFGQHYRKEWATEVSVEILDFDKTAGGLTPIKAGGGLQTKSLRLKGADGNEYVLRSVNKDPSKAVAPELRGTFAEDVVRDQISSANPYAPLVVASLAKAVGVLTIKPKIVYVPSSAPLGEFAKEFAGTVCLFEERPTGDQENNPSFGNSKKVVNTAKMLQRVFEDADHQVDERSFLKARLFDMLIGDWDRHEDQWLWATFKKDGKTIYQPIPRDRDQAFSKLDGVIPQLSTRKWGIRKIQHFDYTIRDINGLNANGAHLDRNFTTRLTLMDWMDVVSEIQNSLTDEVIAAAFSELPGPIYKLDGEETAAKLKRRRDDLHKYATTYYSFLSKEVNIAGTMKKEIFEVNRENEDFTTVVIYKTKHKEKDEIIYQRTFNSAETKEIRLYGLDGNDAFNIKGEAKKSITLRLIGGHGDDSVIDNSFVKKAGRQTKVYDDQDALIENSSEAGQYISNDTVKNGYNRKAFAYDWLSPVVAPGYNPDDGFFIGGGVIFKKQQFGKFPFGHMQTLAGNYAAATGAYSIWYKGVFTEFIGKADLHLSAKYNSPFYTRNYYGLGNETINDENAGKDYYRVRMSEFSLGYSLQRRLGRKHRVWVGSEFQAIEVEDNENRFITDTFTKLDSSVFDRQKYIHTHLGYEFNTLDNSLFPTRGVRMIAGASYIMNTEHSDEKFVQLTSEATFFNTIGRFTLASRTGVSTNVGDDYEFFQANYLGGLTNLRGYRKDRFAGKTNLYQNSEVRIRVSQFNTYLTKGQWGLLAFADFGRVWMPNEDSDTWHSGYGGGVWYLPFNKLAFTATYGVSKEDQVMSIKAGFLF